jgi:hypothetical protein
MFINQQRRLETTRLLTVFLKIRKHKHMHRHRHMHKPRMLTLWRSMQVVALRSGEPRQHPQLLQRLLAGGALRHNSPIPLALAAAVWGVMTLEGSQPPQPTGRSVVPQHPQRQPTLVGLQQHRHLRSTSRHPLSRRLRLVRLLALPLALMAVAMAMTLVRLLLLARGAVLVVRVEILGALRRRRRGDLLMAARHRPSLVTLQRRHRAVVGVVVVVRVAIQPMIRTARSGPCP